MLLLLLLLLLLLSTHRPAWAPKIGAAANIMGVGGRVKGGWEPVGGCVGGRGPVIGRLQQGRAGSQGVASLL